MNTYEIINTTNYKLHDIIIIEGLVNYLLKKENITNAFFNIIFIDNLKIKQINYKYKNQNQPTDVLSFAFEDNLLIKNEQNRMLGDIYISLDKAKQQAIDDNHELLDEILFLITHGLLHLLGYNHESDVEKNIMFEKQEIILNEYYHENGIKKTRNNVD